MSSPLTTSRCAARVLRQAVSQVSRSTRTNALPFQRSLARVAITSSRSFTTVPASRFPGLMPHSEDPEPPKLESTKSRTPASIDDEEYHLHADEFMNKISERAEEVVEKRDDVEVEFSAGVLTIKMPPNGTYVINKQPPNKQIWLSSPITGPKRFDWSIEGESMDQKEGSGVGEWVYIRDGTSLSELLRKELGIDVSVGDLEAQLAQKSTDPVE